MLQRKGILLNSLHAYGRLYNLKSFHFSCRICQRRGASKRNAIEIEKVGGLVAPDRIVSTDSRNNINANFYGIENDVGVIHFADNTDTQSPLIDTDFKKFNTNITFTRFGAVRFDKRKKNVAASQFKSVKFLEKMNIRDGERMNKSSLQNTYISEDLSENSTSNEKDTFHPSASSITSSFEASNISDVSKEFEKNSHSVSERRVDVNSDAFMKSNSAVPEQKKSKHEPTENFNNPSELGFIDQSLFSDSGAFMKSNSAVQEEKIKSKYEPAENFENSRELGFIDQSFFNDSDVLMKNGRAVQEEKIKSKHEPAEKCESSRELSFIDQSFFNDSDVLMKSNSAVQEAKIKSEPAENFENSRELSFIDPSFSGEDMNASNKNIHEKESAEVMFSNENAKSSIFDEQYFSDLAENSSESVKKYSPQMQGIHIERNNFISTDSEKSFLNEPYLKNRSKEDLPGYKNAESDSENAFANLDIHSLNQLNEKYKRNNATPVDLDSEVLNSRNTSLTKEFLKKSRRNKTEILNDSLQQTAEQKKFTYQRDYEEFSNNVLPFKASNNINKLSERGIENNNKQTKLETTEMLKGDPLAPETSTTKIEGEECSTAYEYVRKLRTEKKNYEPELKEGIFVPKKEKLDSKGFKILKNQVPSLIYYTRDEIISMLKNNVLYSDEDVVVLNKPYNLVMHESKTTKDACLSEYLDDFASVLDRYATSPKLLTVHRLDKETAGCLLLARNEFTAQRLKSLFAQRKILKTYWIVTIKIPDPMEGVIDMAISEGTIDKRSRMVLHPELPKDIPYKNYSKGGKRAVTEYKVIATSGSAALVEVRPITGLKHQIRVHFGFGLSCPILGDHKYSYIDKFVPQKLPSDLLQRLHVRQSKVRHIPMHIYARTLLIPQYKEGRNLFVTAPMPVHMSINLQKMKFRKK